MGGGQSADSGGERGARGCPCRGVEEPSALAAASRAAATAATGVRATRYTASTAAAAVASRTSQTAGVGQDGVPA